MKKFKFNQTHNFNWYTILWIVAFLVVLYLFNAWHINQSYVGVVENKSHLVGARESGRVHKLSVEVGEQVKQDQILAVLDISDLKTELSQLKEELSNIMSLENAHKDRFSIVMQSMSLGLENEASNLIERLSLLESKKTEFAGLNAEIKKLQNAEQAGLGHSRELSSLILQRDALETYLEKQNEDLAYQSKKLEKTRRSRHLFEEADFDSMAKSVFLEQMEHAETLRREISLVEHRIQMRTLVAPCDGYVTDIFVRPGDVVEEYLPVLKVEETKPKFLTVYIPEHSKAQPEPGMTVKINSSRNKAFNTTGIITFVHPGFSQAGERISFPGQLFWARKVRVKLNENHHLIPGETVQTRLGEMAGEDYVAVASASENAANGATHADAPPVQDMQVPLPLSKISRFEPSGVVWIPELKKYLIVSDDTGIDKTKSEHAPYLFFMDETGQVAPEPVLLSGIKTVNDLEAITYAGDDIFYLVSSQNISKKGNRPKNREQLLKVKRNGEKFTVVGELKLLSALNTFPREKLLSLGLEKNEKDGQPLLNIEGASFFEHDLYFGLKEPVSEKGAIIWKLEDVNRAFSTGQLRADQLSVYGYIDLGKSENNTPGFSDLVFDKNGDLWALSTIADVGNEDQLGAFSRIKRFADGRLESKRLMNFPRIKPEGLCVQNAGQFLIVFDNDEKTAAFCTIDAEAL